MPRTKTTAAKTPITAESFSAAMLLTNTVDARSPLFTRQRGSVLANLCRKPGIFWMGKNLLDRSIMGNIAAFTDDKSRLTSSQVMVLCQVVGPVGPPNLEEGKALHGRQCVGRSLWRRVSMPVQNGPTLPGTPDPGGTASLRMTVSAWTALELPNETSRRPSAFGSTSRGTWV